eukprot:gnl/MRDRNA2_/MRDRNA2_30336_c0_seq1.p1 gnl/MRDRNA2_/MRDRNA2_30336_c0~~gnl/MRDRNA2_/MRDRNA2_30336_c0_seq1.p1  ORF type:complete len:309 (+),score=56.13 gnl/MRDRNA2_/MRDRNA2_30336_c0_seq1:102-929(+)
MRGKKLTAHLADATQVERFNSVIKPLLEHEPHRNLTAVLSPPMKFKVPHNSAAASGIRFLPQGCQMFEAEVLVADIGTLGSWRYLVGLKALTPIGHLGTDDVDAEQESIDDSPSLRNRGPPQHNNRAEDDVINNASCTSTETDTLSLRHPGGSLGTISEACELDLHQVWPEWATFMPFRSLRSEVVSIMERMPLAFHNKKCCNWHLALEQISKCLKQIHAEGDGACKMLWFPNSGWQCKACFSLMQSEAESEQECPLCGEVQELSRVPCNRLLSL